MKRGLAVLASATFALGALGALGGCAKKTTREDVVAMVKKQGIPPDKADCVADGMIKKFGLETLSSDRDPTPAEVDAMATIIIDCGAVPGLTSSTTAAP